MKEAQPWNRSPLELPSEVIWDILCRLPIKTCLRCKLVCKDWYNIIISPRFADLRRSYCSRLTSLMLYCRFPNGRLNFLLLELGKESNNVDHEGSIRVGTDCMIKFKSRCNVPNGQLIVGNFCNGLVCLKSAKRWGCYYICNLLTSQFVTVEQFQPRAHSFYGYVLGSCLVNNVVLGDPKEGNFTHISKEVDLEGSSPITHQYKLLRILKTRSEYVADILTIGSNEWRRIDGAPNSYYKFEAFLNSSYHWYDGWNGEPNLWAFDFGTEKFLLIPTPNEFKMRRGAILTVFDSFLCFCCIYENTKSEIWLMKEYGIGKSWVRQLVIHLPEPLWPIAYKPLTRVDNGRMILISRCVCHLALYDPETRAYKRVKVEGLSNIKTLEACDVDFSWMLGGLQGD